MDLQSTNNCYNFYDEDVSSEFATINEYRKRKKFTNFILLTPDGTKYHVHKMVISTACPYFKGLFNSNLKETKQTETQLDRNVSPNDFEAILTYMYTGRIQITVENAFIINENACYFGLNKLKEASEKALTKNVSLENVLALWRWAEKSSNNELKKICGDFILQNSGKFFEQYLLSLEYNEVLITFSNYNFGHDQLYNYLTKWIKHDFENREKYIVDLLKRIDFVALSTDFISNQIKTDSILMNSTIYNELLIDALLKIKSFHGRNQLQNAKVMIKKEIIKTSIKTENIKEENVTTKLDDLIFLITPRYISGLNLKKPVPRFVPITKLDFNKTFQPIYNNSDNIIFCGLEDGTSCKSFSYRTNTFNDLSPMLESRQGFGISKLEEKIFVCGGQSNKGSTEIYDINTDKWFCGESMSNHHLYDFKLLNYNRSIYTFGGSFEYEGVNAKGEIFKRISSSHLIQRFDPRENFWEIVSSENSIINVIEALSVKENTIKLFTHSLENYKVEVHDYDIRNNSMRKLPSELPLFRQCNFYKSQDDIYLLGIPKGSFFQNKLGRLDTTDDIVKFTELFSLYMSCNNLGAAKLLNVGFDQYNYFNSYSSILSKPEI